MKKVLSISVAIALLLTALCSAALAEKDTSGLLATVNGVDLSIDEALADYEYAAMIYEMYGYTEEDLQALRESIARMYVEEYLISEKIDELEIEADTARVQELAQAEYAEALEYYMSMLDDGEMTEEELTAAAEEALASSGYSPEEFEEYYYDYVLQEALIDACLPEISATDDEVLAYYEQRLAEDQELFDADPYYYEEALSNSETVTYVPEGFRSVKHILVMLDDADQTRMYEIENRLLSIEEEMTDESADTDALEEEKQTLEQERETILDSIRPTISEIQNRLSDGEDFLALLDEYGEDTGMQMEPYKSDGYAVWSGSYMEEAFLEAALALENEGDISDPVATPYGMHIIRYERAIPSGPVAYDEVKSALCEELEYDMLNDAYAELLEQWYSEADVTLYLENLTADEAEDGETGDSEIDDSSSETENS